MPKATFEDFIKDSPIHKALAGNPDAKAVFNIINEDVQIYEAICASERGRPALEASVGRIEEYIKSRIEKKRGTTFDLDVDFNRQAAGRMQQTVLARFGYKSQGTQKSLKAKWFRTASCYRKLSGPELEQEEWKGRRWKDVATMKVIVKITTEEV